jgi:PPM family protein phosphatase
MHAQLEFAVKTDTGLVRTQNEDALAVIAECGLAVLADGMGGYEAGEVASQIATETVARCLATVLQPDSTYPSAEALHALLSNAVQEANAGIIAAARANPAYAGMGTTIVVSVIQDALLTIAHVGDSRAYRLRDDVFQQITKDHSLLQEQIDAGLLTIEESRFSANRNLVTRAVGVDEAVSVEVHDHALQAGDLYLLCSDGLSDMLEDSRIHDILRRYPDNLQQACDTLVEEANRAGGRDNISVILFRDGSEPARNGLLGRLRNWIS